MVEFIVFPSEKKMYIYIYIYIYMNIHNHVTKLQLSK
jgi:hypothetical protein